MNRPEPPRRYVIVCDCDGTDNLLGWINDERPAAYGINFGATPSARVGELRLGDGPNHSVQFGHVACGVTVDLSRRNLGELVDAMTAVQRQIGCRTVEVEPMTWRRGQPEGPEQRVVIELAMLARVNGELTRGRTTPRRRPS